MIPWKSRPARLVVAGLVTAASAAMATGVTAGPPRTQSQYDMSASGFVMPPSGPVPEGAYMPGPGMGGQMNMRGMTPPMGPMGGSPMGSMGGSPIGPMSGAPMGMPAGMGMPPGLMQPPGVPAGGVAPAGYQSGPVSMNQYPAAGSMSTGGPVANPVQQTGFFGGGDSSCDSIGCDSCGSSIGCGCGLPSGGCDGGCGDSGCGCSLEAICQGGLLGKLTGRGTCEACGGGGCQGCGFGGGSQMSNLRHLCLFCRGGGCAVCQSMAPLSIAGALQRLQPYSEGGKCAPRFYDVSVEASFLGLNGGGTGALASRGIGGPIVLDTGDFIDGLEAGVKVSGAMIFGVGGNLEFTYHGAHQWDGSGTVTGDNDLYSFISEFGTLPTGGFDDTDESVLQTAAASARFHSGELNYRRRTMGPYCRFQGSYLFGLRYVRYDNSLDYDIAAGEDNDGDAVDDFFSLESDATNDLFGGQIGFDVWYSAVPGINLGLGLKGAWMKNEINTDGSISSNSTGLFATPGTAELSNGREDDGTVLLDFELVGLYRITRSLTLRGGYQVIAIDDISTAGFNRQGIIDAAVNGPGSTSQFEAFRDSLVLQGFTVGAEYAW